MRFIGSKRRMLTAITDLLKAQGVCGGSVLDIFAGTAVVGRHFKEQGFHVTTNDRMGMSFVLQKALVVADAYPADFEQHRQDMEQIPPSEGLITRQYSPLGKAGRMFFRPQHAQFIDAATSYLASQRRLGTISDDAFFLLLAGVLEGANVVSNITGTYGAYLKSWQTNTNRPFALRVPEPVGRQCPEPCVAYCEDSNTLVGTVDCDVLYIDPPYNTREYSANYHVLEAIAQSAMLPLSVLPTFEAGIYGKTGLLPYTKSAFCQRKAVEQAFAELIAKCRAKQVVVSYSEEGLLSAEAIRNALASGLATTPEAVVHETVVLKRFRSDADGRIARLDGERATSARSYTQIEGRGRDELHEWLFYGRSEKL